MLHRWMMETEAWRALSSTAQALYPWLRLEWGGPKFNNNGKLSLSYSQAAQKMGIGSHDTIAKAFKDLQAKGFVIVHLVAYLGTGGHSKSSQFELTDIPMQGKHKGCERFKDWKRGYDFEIKSANSNNPIGYNGKTKSHHENYDGSSRKT